MAACSSVPANIFLYRRSDGVSEVSAAGGAGEGIKGPRRRGLSAVASCGREGIHRIQRPCPREVIHVQNSSKCMVPSPFLDVRDVDEVYS